MGAAAGFAAARGALAVVALGDFFGAADLAFFAVEVLFFAVAM